jgi:hypothetical protein
MTRGRANGRRGHLGTCLSCHGLGYVSRRRGAPAAAPGRLAWPGLPCPARLATGRLAATRWNSRALTAAPPPRRPAGAPHHSSLRARRACRDRARRHQPAQDDSRQARALRQGGGGPARQGRRRGQGRAAVMRCRCLAGLVAGLVASVACWGAAPLLQWRLCIIMGCSPAAEQRCRGTASSGSEARCRLQGLASARARLARVAPCWLQPATGRQVPLSRAAGDLGSWPRHNKASRSLLTGALVNVYCCCCVGGGGVFSASKYCMPRWLHWPWQAYVVAVVRVWRGVQVWVCIAAARRGRRICFAHAQAGAEGCACRVIVQGGRVGGTGGCTSCPPWCGSIWECFRGSRLHANSSVPVLCRVCAGALLAIAIQDSGGAAAAACVCVRAGVAGGAGRSGRTRLVTCCVLPVVRGVHLLWGLCFLLWVLFAPGCSAWPRRVYLFDRSVGSVVDRSVWLQVWIGGRPCRSIECKRTLLAATAVGKGGLALVTGNRHPQPIKGASN